MIALLILAVTSGVVLVGCGGFRQWTLARRSAGDLVQELVKPASADALFWGSGTAAVLCVMGLMVIDPVAFSWGGWTLTLAFGFALFEAACWASGLYRFAFHQRGLWYGRSWYLYRELYSFEIDRDLVSLMARGRRLTFRSVGTLSAEIRLKLAVEGFS